MRACLFALILSALSLKHHHWSNPASKIKLWVCFSDSAPPIYLRSVIHIRIFYRLWFIFLSTTYSSHNSQGGLRKNKRKGKQIQHRSLHNSTVKKINRLASPRLELETFSVLDWRDNQLHHDTFGSNTATSTSYHHVVQGNVLIGLKMNYLRLGSKFTSKSSWIMRSTQVNGQIIWYERGYFLWIIAGRRKSPTCRIRTSDLRILCLFKL